MEKARGCCCQDLNRLGEGQGRMLGAGGFQAWHQGRSDPLFPGLDQARYYCCCLEQSNLAFCPLAFFLVEVGSCSETQ